jgi:hypothetical protein
LISKREDFLSQNAIVKHVNCEKTDKKESKTIITFSTLAENSGVYNDLTEQNLKEKLLERYIHYFCYNKNNLPKIQIEHFVQSKLKGQTSITKIDIPNSDKSKTLKLSYTKKTKSGFEKTDKTDNFIIDAFKIPKTLLKDNKLNLVSKGEVIEESDVVLESLSKGDVINGNKYLFLVSSDYIDSKDSNLRGILNIPSKDSFEKDLFANKEEILIEDIQEKINSSIDTMYPEIEDVKQKHNEGFAKLKEMFLLDDKTAKDLNISINDSETKILEKFYEAEAKKAAAVDAKIKETFEKLITLDTTNDDFTEDFRREVEQLVKSIPLQNKNALTHYVARRKLILELFGKILDKKLKVQMDGNSGKGKEEALIHNLLFQQGSDRPEDSDLWIINEDFIYFKGSSEKRLSLLEIDGLKVFKDEFSEEEEKYLKSLGENRTIRRPDVLLFPEEGKCIILEFKAPDVNASDYLTQIDFYASLIRNYTNEVFQITTFYGYLIGESIEPRDVLGRVSRYEHSYQFDYLFRPSEKVNGFNGRTDGSIYTEVLKYTTLLERAIQRNKIFIEKLK